MTLAEQIAEKYVGRDLQDGRLGRDGWNDAFVCLPAGSAGLARRIVAAALSEMRRLTWAEAKEAAAKEADELVNRHAGIVSDQAVAVRYAGRELAARIRSLKTEPASEVDGTR